MEESAARLIRKLLEEHRRDPDLNRLRQGVGDLTAKLHQRAQHHEERAEAKLLEALAIQLRAATSRRKTDPTQPPTRRGVADGRTSAKLTQALDEHTDDPLQLLLAMQEISGEIRKETCEIAEDAARIRREALEAHERAASERRKLMARLVGGQRRVRPSAATPITALSDEGAIFELLSELGCRPPRNGDR